jgi:hypothetical protein
VTMPLLFTQACLQPCSGVPVLPHVSPDAKRPRSLQIAMQQLNGVGSQSQIRSALAKGRGPNVDAAQVPLAQRTAADEQADKLDAMMELTLQHLQQRTVRKALVLCYPSHPPRMQCHTTA